MSNDHHAAARVDPGALDSVEALTVLPLVEARAAHDDLICERGLSYLVCAGSSRILFDLGLGGAVAANAHTLGVDRWDVDTVVVSHLHPDHVGGLRAARRRSPRLPDDLDAPIVAPIRVTHGRVRCIEAATPTIIAKGVATSGAIPRRLMLLGLTYEQSLVVRVRNVGAVVIVGCGHPGIERILDRVESIVDCPIAAIIGGLHYPVRGLHAQALIGSPRWRPVTARDLHRGIESIAQRKPMLVAVSPHDSSEWTLARFREAFGDRFRIIRAGDPIEIRAVTDSHGRFDTEVTARETSLRSSAAARSM